MRVPEETIAIAERLQKLSEDLAYARDAVDLCNASLKIAEDNVKRAVSNAALIESSIQTEVRKLCGAARSPAFKQADAEARAKLGKIFTATSGGASTSS